MPGVSLDHGCRITHGEGAALKAPFPDMPLRMHELSRGGSAFSGQLGFIPFTTAIRLPRHVHMGAADGVGTRRLLAERILVLDGCGLVELAGELHIVVPGSLVEIAAGVPHSWTACPPGVRLPDGTQADGTFLMVYEYEAPTGFFPTAATAPLTDPSGYEAFDGHDSEPIRIPRLSPAEAAARASLVWNERVLRCMT